MSQTAQPRASRAPSSAEMLADLYGPVAAPLADVEELLRSELRSQHPAVDELVRYGCLLGGKRLRPALLLLTGQAAGGELTRSHIVLAAVVEMIHTATLVHDDVLDQADMRRHLATVNSRWDNEASVLLGDYLFTHAFYLASTLETTLACRWIGQATNVVCEGELRQKVSRRDFTLGEDQYLSMIDAKTAELCACACRLGAHFAGAGSQLADEMALFGRELGIAFQIVDDLLDMTGSEQATGKSLGTDFDQRIMTLPLIHVMSQADAQERAELTELLQSDAGHQQLAPYLQRHDALGYARRRAEQYAASAQNRLQQLPPSPAAETLGRVTQFVVRRTR